MDCTPASDVIKMLLSNPKRTMRLKKYMDMSLKDVLDIYVTDPVVENLFDLLIATCYCTNIDETPLILSAPIIWETFHGGAVYPQGSPQMFPNALERSVEKFGGHMLYRHMVDEILIEDNEAYGVRLDDGTIINAGSVVSDATVWNLYGNLIDEKHIDPDRMKWAQELKPTLSSFLVFLGVKASVIPEGTNAIEVFVNDLDNFTNDSTFCYLPSIDDPSICPKGTHSITALCSTGGIEWPKPTDPDYQSEEYKKLKEEFAQKTIELLDKKFPGLKDNIIVMDMATPSTIEHYTLKNGGNIGGPKQAIGQHLMNRLHARSEFKNLYCVGDSTVMGEGVVSASVSAVGAVNMILEDSKPKRKRYKVGKYKKQYINYVKGQYREPMPDIADKLDETTASRVATECQWCENDKAECMKQCPAGIDVLNFIRRLESKNYIGAAKSMREMNPLSAICGYICPAERLCESKCSHKEV
jgi:prolycopene isomerase